jgi:DNA helicase II / ATP-dependent DNA helicase PcrA
MKRYKLDKTQHNNKLTLNKEFKINYKKELNPQQLRAVCEGDGASLILAGPGSGKTRVLVYRVAFLIENGVSPENILLLTFTNKAAKNMLWKVEKLLGYYPKGLTGGTFHHTGNLFLRKYAKLLGYKNNFSIIDNSDSKQLIKEIINLTYPKRNKHFPKAGVIFSIASFAKNAVLDINRCIEKNYKEYSKYSKKINNICQIYEKRKKISNLMDFDDLLYNMDKLLLNDSLNTQLSNKFKYVLVDEFQDTNKLQINFIKKLTKGKNNNIFVVGDDCQSIYSFRAAEIKNILNFPKFYKNYKEFKLEENYRSTPQILDFINYSINKNKKQYKKILKTKNKRGRLPSIISCKDNRQEAEYVGQRILELNEEGVDFDNIGILFRADYLSANMELELIKRNIPYVKRGGLKFFEKKHIKDITSFVKIFDNEEDELAWKRILCLFEGVGPATAAEIWDKIKNSENIIKAMIEYNLIKSNTQNLSELKKILKFVLKDMQSPQSIIDIFLKKYYGQYIKDNFLNHRDRKLDILQYMKLASQYSNLTKFLEDVLLDADLTNKENPSLVGSSSPKLDKKIEEKCVTLSTIHQSKGLEWRNLFLISVTKDRFPSIRVKGKKELEEERRVFYVACSRAKKYLEIGAPLEDFTPWGGYQILGESKFIKEISKKYYEEWIVDEEE